MRPQQLGDIEISKVVDLDGWGFVPDFLFPDASAEAVEAEREWMAPACVDDESGELMLSFHAFVLRTPRHVILVDACVGNDKPRPLRQAWHRRRGPFLERLAAAGVRPEDVDIVMCTHMHADHVGWNTRLVDGRWVPTFPNARYVFARAEYEHWERAAREHDGEPLNHGSFDDSVLPVVEAGRAVLVESDHQIEDGIWLEPAPGHTPGNVVLNVVSGEARAVLSGDVLHHPVQLAHPEWSSRFCDDPDLSRRTRRALIERHADGPTLLLTAHFTAPTAGTIESRGDAFRFRYRDGPGPG